MAAATPNPPVPYQEINREALSILKPEIFHGIRLDFAKQITPEFALLHSISTEHLEIPSKIPDTILRTPINQYALGVSYSNPTNKFGLVGSIRPDGILNARLVSQVTSKINLSVFSLISNQPTLSNVIGNLDYGGDDFKAQLQLGLGGLAGVNYMQSVTNKLSLGGEVLFRAEQGTSAVGFGTRYVDEEKKNVASGQISSNGNVCFSYCRRLTDKLTVASDFLYNYLSRDVVGSVGYCFAGGQSVVTGKIDTNGKVSAVMEEQLLRNAGLKFVVCAEMDHFRKDSKIGVGLSI